MKPGNTALRICRACGRSSSKAPRSSNPASRTWQHAPSQLRSISSTRSCWMQPSADISSSDPLPTRLPESTLLNALPPTSKPELKPQPQETASPFPPIPPEPKMRTTVGTVKRIHTNTAYVERNMLSWDGQLRKYYNRTTHDLVHDPTSLLRVGDIIKYTLFTPEEVESREKRKDAMYKAQEAKGIDTGRGEKVTKKGFVVSEGKRLVMVGAKLEAINKSPRNSKGVRFVCREVVTPFGNSIAERMPQLKKAGWLVDHEENYGRTVGNTSAAV